MKQPKARIVKILPFKVLRHSSDTPQGVVNGEEAIVVTEEVIVAILGIGVAEGCFGEIMDGVFMGEDGRLFPFPQRK